jgi:hypothetical protein
MLITAQTNARVARGPANPMQTTYSPRRRYSRGSSQPK